MQTAGGADPVAGRRATAVLLGAAAVTVALDQTTKALAVSGLRPGESKPFIDGVLHWTLQRNPGAAFSLFTKFPVAFTVLAFVIAVVILFKSRSVRGTLNGLALGLVLGGAVGNLVDRIARPPGIFRGHVIDFIDFRVWPVFNVADMGVVIGAALVVLASFMDERRRRG